MDYIISKLISEVNQKLGNGDNCLKSSNDPIFLGQALLSYHGALEAYFRALIISTQPDKKNEVLDKKVTNWPVLLDYGKQYLGLSEEEARIIKIANDHRIPVAHGEGWDWNYNDLIHYTNLVKKWCSKDLESYSTKKNNFNNGRQIREKYEKPNESYSNEPKSPTQPTHPKQSSNLPLGCMWFLFIFATPMWAIIILFDKNISGCLKFICTIYLLALLSMICFLSSSGLLSVTELTNQIESSDWETLTNPFQEILADDRLILTPVSSPKIVKTPHCEIIWEDYQGSDLKNKNRFMVWEEIVSQEIKGSTLTYQKFLKQVLEYNPRLTTEDYVFRENIKYKLPKCK